MRIRQIQLYSISICLLLLLSAAFGAFAQNSILANATSIEGTVLMLDDRTPHVAIVVQAVRPARDGNTKPTVAATTLSDENGDYQFINLPPGQYQIRCYTISGYVYHREGKILQARSGKPLKGIDFRIAPFKKGAWKSYNYLDGLAGDYVRAINQTPDGMIWFGIGGGVSRYNGKDFTRFGEEDGFLPGHAQAHLPRLRWCSMVRNGYWA